MAGRVISAAAAAAMLVSVACYEPTPQPEPKPMWVWFYGPTSSDLYDLASTARNDVWAVGVNSLGDGEVLHFSAFNWTFAEMPPVKVGPLYAVDAVASGDAWAAGGGDYFLYWTGSAWKSWPHPAAGKTVYGLDMVNDTLGWAVGAAGLILKFDGTGWAEVTSPATTTLRRVQALSGGSAWAVGDGGTVLHYDGSSWQTVAFAPTVDLNDLYFFSDSDGWVVGDVASLYRWDGAAFTRNTSPDPDMNYLACAFVDETLGWAGGNEMHIARFAGAAWEFEQNLPSGSWEVYAMHLVSDTEGWAVGPRGTMMHYR